ncbi:MAG: hypothetical protein JXA68_10325, partial [Ignavibacteriales bacterium]|nr:hypothetical protein [Ignavibacteriales bacterium]
MEKLHKDYIKYYETRVNKYKGNPSYKNSYETEKALYDAIASCKKLEDFKDKVEKGNLAVNNGVALVKDREKIQNDHYNKLKEFIRAGASKEILETLGKKEIKTAMELANLCTEIEQKHHLNITLDELGIAQFLFDYFILENIEAWQNAEVVDEFKKEINEE